MHTSGLSAFHVVCGVRSGAAASRLVFGAKRGGCSEQGFHTDDGLYRYTPELRELFPRPQRVQLSFVAGVATGFVLNTRIRRWLNGY